MKIQSSFETLYALIFAACVLLALFLLTACDRETPLEAATRPAVRTEQAIAASGPRALPRLEVRKTAPAGG